MALIGFGWRCQRPHALAMLIMVISLSGAPAAALGTRTADAEAAMATFANGERGVVVWQSRRTGRLRIFASGLDGSNLRQLSPDVAGRDHIAPLLSPDGQQVLYYETFVLSDATFYADHIGDMMLIDVDDTDGSTVQQLVAEVRTYWECRFARWLDAGRSTGNLPQSDLTVSQSHKCRVPK